MDARDTGWQNGWEGLYKGATEAMSKKLVSRAFEGSVDGLVAKLCHVSGQFEVLRVVGTESGLKEAQVRRNKRFLGGRWWCTQAQKVERLPTAVYAEL